MVVALIALGVALGGTSYAATKLPRNSVTTKQIKNNSVTSAKVKDRTLRSQDFAPGQLPAGERGAQGPQGDRGAQGERGATGTVDTSNFFTKSESDNRFLPVGGTAVNASQLGGVGANGFVRGSRGWLSYSVLAGEQQDVPVSNLGGIRVTCSDPAATATIRWAGVPATSVMTHDHNAGTTAHSALTGGSTLGPAIGPGGANHVTWLVGGGTDLDMVEAFSVPGFGGAGACALFYMVDKNRPS
jgi:hypothetical protein